MSEKKTQWERCVEEACAEYKYASIEDFNTTVTRHNPINVISSMNAVFKHAADLYAMRFLEWQANSDYESWKINNGILWSDATMNPPKLTEQLLEQFNNQEE